MSNSEILLMLVAVLGAIVALGFLGVFLSVVFDWRWRRSYDSEHYNREFRDGYWR